MNAQRLRHMLLITFRLYKSSDLASSLCIANAGSILCLCEWLATRLSYLVFTYTFCFGLRGFAAGAEFVEQKNCIIEGFHQ